MDADLLSPGRNLIEFEEASRDGNTAASAFPDDGRALVLLPAYNEERAIGGVIEGVLGVSRRWRTTNIDVLVVDGHSTDRTPHVARELGARVITQPGMGKGDAVRHGIREIADHSYIVMLDADASYPTEEIPRLISPLKEEADVVIGSRLQGVIEPGAMSMFHQIGNRFLSRLASLLFGRRVSDVCSGMWAFTKKAINALQLNSNQFELEAEFFAQACKAKLRIQEIPIVYRNRIGSRKLVSLSTGIRIALKLIRKRFAP